MTWRRAGACLLVATVAWLVSAVTTLWLALRFRSDMEVSV